MPKPKPKPHLRVPSVTIKEPDDGDPAHPVNRPFDVYCKAYGVNSVQVSIMRLVAGVWTEMISKPAIQSVNSQAIWQVTFVVRDIPATPGDPMDMITATATSNRARGRATSATATPVRVVIT
jgi:hypothetical protein